MPTLGTFLLAVIFAFVIMAAGVCGIAYIASRKK